MALAADLGVDPAGERVDHGNADAVQAAGDGVSAAAELAAGVQDGHDDFNGGLVLGGVHVHGDAAAVVDHLDAAVGLQDDFDVRAVAGQGLVDRVVHHFVDQVVQAARSGGSDVHARAFPDGLQAFKHGDVAGAVFPCGVTASAGASAVRASSAACSTAGISALSLATGAFDSSMFVEGRPLPLPEEKAPANRHVADGAG